MGKRLDINPGDRYSRLTIIGEVEKRGEYRCFNCKCDCGNETIVRLGNLRNGHTTSCGCYSKESLSKIGKKNTTHGMKKTSEYRSWRSMKTRCYNPNIKNYKDWGGRGISVCDRWLNSFENFFEDMGKKPGKEYSIDRINNDGNYEPSNCKWATKKEQSNNQRPKTKKLI